MAKNISINIFSTIEAAVRNKVNGYFWVERIIVMRVLYSKRLSLGLYKIIRFSLLYIIFL